MSAAKPKALYITGEGVLNQVYGPSELDEISTLVDVYAPPQTAKTVAADPALLNPAEVILGSWGLPRMDEKFLAAVPHLKAVFYAAGSVRGFTSDALWQRGVLVSSAWAANAVPVAEYTLAQILFSLKQGWYFVLETKRQARRIPAHARVCAGGYQSTVGLISLGMIGRRVAELLKPFELQLLAYDPFVQADAARELGITLCSLDDLFRQSDVVSLHTPWLKETEGLITGAHFSSMKPNATFLNTARGAVVRETEMIPVLQARPDLTAVLDVTWPEPPAENSPLFTLPNVVLTPHIAGSKDAECRRMARYMIDELKAWLGGRPLRWQVTKEKAALLA